MICLRNPAPRILYVFDLCKTLTKMSPLQCATLHFRYDMTASGVMRHTIHRLSFRSNTPFAEGIASFAKKSFHSHSVLKDVSTDMRFAAFPLRHDCIEGKNQRTLYSTLLMILS